MWPTNCVSAEIGSIVRLHCIFSISTFALLFLAGVGNPRIRALRQNQFRDPVRSGPTQDLQATSGDMFMLAAR